MKRNLTIWTLIALLATFVAACNNGGEEVIQNKDNIPQTKGDWWEEDRWAASEEEGVEVFMADSLLIVGISPVETYNDLMSYFTVECDMEDISTPVDYAYFTGWFWNWGGNKEYVYEFPHNAEAAFQYMLFVDNFDYSYYYPEHLYEAYYYERRKLTINCDKLSAWSFNFKMMMTLFDSLTINATHKNPISDPGLIDYWIIQWRRLLKDMMEDEPQIDILEPDTFFAFTVNGVDMDTFQRDEIDRLNTEMASLHYGIKFIVND